MKRSHGFTFLEVLIVMAIMSFILIGTITLTRRAFETRQKLLAYSDFYGEIRLAIKLFEKDLTLMFSPIAFKDRKQSRTNSGENIGSFTDEEIATFAQIFRGSERQASDYWGAIIDNTGIRPSRFQGKSNAIQFVSSSNQRIYRESKESIFNKIHYELRETKSEGEDYLAGTRTLIRNTSAHAFEFEDDRDGKDWKTYPLVEGIKEFKIRYFEKKRDRWVDEWDSESNDFKNRYPDLIEVSMTVAGPENLNFNGVFRMKAEMPFEDLGKTY